MCIYHIIDYDTDYYEFNHLSVPSGISVYTPSVTIILIFRAGKWDMFTT